MLDQGALLYLELLKKCLTRLAFPDEYRPLLSFSMPVGKFQRRLQPLLLKLHFGLYRLAPIDLRRRGLGLDWPAEAETMVGLQRLDMLQRAFDTIVRENIPGDLLEAGTWRGGAAIFMRALLRAYQQHSRVVWVADSFKGLPRPDGRYNCEKGSFLWRGNWILAVPMAQVQRNFGRYGLLDQQVQFLPGWFKDTLPHAPIEHLSLLRLDGDLYSSTTDALSSLYAKVSPGGFVVIDDYGLRECRTAVQDFRVHYNICEPIQDIDGSAVFWRKESRPVDGKLAVVHSLVT